MEDSRLNELFPRMGDRVMVMNFCQRHIAPKRQSLIDRLKHKIEEKNSSMAPSGSAGSSGKPHRKYTRMVELGWMHAVGRGDFHYVRKLQGGGTRQVQFGRDAPVRDLKEKAIELFFPGGRSPKGVLSEFTSVEMVDFKMNELDESLKIHEYFDITKLSKLRFYLATRQDSFEPAKGEMKKFRGKLPRKTRSKKSSEIKINHEQTIVTEIRDDIMENPDANNLTNMETSKDDEEFDAFFKSVVDNIDVQQIISTHTTRIHVYREDVFGCCLRALRRKNFKPFHKIRVDFTDIDEKTEGAVDEGGPTREMFRLLLNSLAESSLFTGEPMKYLSLNNTALKNNSYFEAGRIIALSLVHGGSGPHFFSETLYCLLVYGVDKTTFTMRDIEPEIADKLKIFQGEDDLSTLRDIILSDTIFATAGCHFIAKKEDKDVIIEGRTTIW
ncbi:unnamed protein product [Phaedon cochleariae]|uniref:HECT domain-containing protein n=1 Tax=Phaedon cochleariae TaxID=80249 RepID=A0A9N9X4X1_PHACE|nr:unnamed protein product [Phaedon cochleariae]